MAPNKVVAPQRREAIIAATIRCLARDGYSRLTMKTLAREAGVSQGILHYYFKDKAAILVAVLEAVTADLERRIVQAQTEGEQTPQQGLHAVIATCLSTTQAQPELWRVYVQLWGEMMHDDALRTINADLYIKMRRQVATLLSKGIRVGAFRRVDVGQAAAMIVGLIDGMALQLTFDAQALPLDSAIPCCCETVERYLRP
jgi:AcrR family transcriptional regulator